MKKNLLIISVLFSTIFAAAQTDKEELVFLQDIFGMEKKPVVARFVETTEAQDEAFWTLYDEYETQRKELGKQRIDLLLQYAEKYETMTSEQAEEWTKQEIKLKSKTDKLITTYFKKVKKVSDGTVATQFYQIEIYILNAVRGEILSDIPFVVK